MIDAISDEDLRALAAIDALAVTDHLRERFGQDQIYVTSQAWGATLRVLAVREPPELYGAFIGTGQVVSQRETDKTIYTDANDWAHTTGRDGLVDTVLPATIAGR